MMATEDYMLRMKHEITSYEVNWIPVKIKMELYLIYNRKTKFVNAKSKELTEKLLIRLKTSICMLNYDDGMVLF